MIVTVLVGNTNTRLCWWRKTRLAESCSLSTGRLLLNPARALGRVQPADGAAIASVVPAATAAVTKHLLRVLGVRPLVVGPGTATGLSFAYPRRQLGADRVCAAVGARQHTHDNWIVMDLGTATTVNVVLAEGRFLGGLVMPGVDMMLRGLAQGTALLPAVSLKTRPPALGRSTRTAVRAGVFGLLAGGLSHIVSAIEQQTGRAFKVILTGGRARLFSRALGRPVLTDPLLASRGLAHIYEMNRH